MTRTVMRYVDWRVSPAEDSPILFEMECTTCADLPSRQAPDSKSSPSEDFADVQDWALQHSGRHPSHTSYREHVMRYWRTSMTDGPRAT